MSNLTTAQFSEQCAYLAKNAAAWAADCLTLPEYIDKAADPEVVARFTDDMRRRLDRLDERAGRSLPATDTARPLNSGEVEALREISHLPCNRENSSDYNRGWNDARFRARQIADAALSSAPSTPEGWRDIPVTDENVSYVMQYGGRCRECADAMGVCPTSGLPCIADEARSAIRHTLRAINYGMAHGFLPTAPAGGSGNE